MKEKGRYESIKKEVTKLVLGAKPVSTSEALRKAGFHIIEETKHFGDKPQEIKKT